MSVYVRVRVIIIMAIHGGAFVSVPAKHASLGKSASLKFVSRNLISHRDHTSIYYHRIYNFVSVHI